MGIWTFSPFLRLHTKINVHSSATNVLGTKKVGIREQRQIPIIATVYCMLYICTGHTFLSMTTSLLLFDIMSPAFTPIPITTRPTLMLIHRLLRLGRGVSRVIFELVGCWFSKSAHNLQLTAVKSETSIEVGRCSPWILCLRIGRVVVQL